MDKVNVDNLEDMYYGEMLAAENELDKVREENTKLKQQIIFMREALSSVVTEIFELTTTDEDDCPCGGDCGCKGDDCIETID